MYLKVKHFFFVFVTAFSEVELAAHCMTFFINGAETASIQLTFTLFELAVNSDVQEKLRNEIKQAVNNVREFDYDKLWGLPYLEMVISGIHLLLLLLL